MTDTHPTDMPPSSHVGAQERSLLPQGRPPLPKPIMPSPLLPFASDWVKGGPMAQFWPISHKKKFSGKILGKILLPDKKRTIC